MTFFIQMLCCFGIISNLQWNKIQVNLAPYLKKKKKKQTVLASVGKNKYLHLLNSVDVGSCNFVDVFGWVFLGVFSSFKMGGRKYFVLECQELGSILFPLIPLPYCSAREEMLRSALCWLSVRRVEANWDKGEKDCRTRRERREEWVCFEICTDSLKLVLDIGQQNISNCPFP